MLSHNFYHATIKRYTTAFARLFNDIEIIRTDDIDDTGEFVENIKVPLTYANKEKFYERINGYDSSDENITKVQITLPRMSYEFISMFPAHERRTNAKNKIIRCVDDNGIAWAYNRTPYDFEFGLNIATRRIEDLFQIQEQIIPFFNPYLSMTLKNSGALEVDEQILVVLNTPTHEIISDGSIKDDERRVVQGTLTFTIQGNLYKNVNTGSFIRQSCVSVGESIGNPQTKLIATADENNNVFCEKISLENQFLELRKIDIVSDINSNENVDINSSVKVVVDNFFGQFDNTLFNNAFFTSDGTKLIEGVDFIINNSNGSDITFINPLSSGTTLINVKNTVAPKNNFFIQDFVDTLPLTPQLNHIYITNGDSNINKWNGSEWVVITPRLQYQIITMNNDDLETYYYSISLNSWRI